MDDSRDALVLGVAACAAVVLQIVLAPNIVLFGAMPNLILACVVALSVARPGGVNPAFAFALGLLYDLLGSGPVGAFAFLCVLASFALPRVVSLVGNGTAFIPLALAGIASLVVEFAYALFVLAFGAPVGLGEALLFRVVPCALYDCVAAFALFFLFARLFSGERRAVAPRVRLR